MDDEGREAPAEQVPAAPPPMELAVAEAVAQTTSGAPPLAIFLGMTAMLLISFGAAALVLAGAGRVVTGGSEATPTPQTPPPARTAGAAAAATADASRVHVVSTSGRSRAIGSGAQYEVTFGWTLEGARENDPVVLQFSAGTRALGQQRGTLDPSVFNFSTGSLTLIATMDCSTGGWTAEILTIRGQPIAGDSEAKAAGVQCR